MQMKADVQYFAVVLHCTCFEKYLTYLFQKYKFFSLGMSTVVKRISRTGDLFTSRLFFPMCNLNHILISLFLEYFTAFYF